MRIISGKHRGKIIKPPKGFSDRPTTDFAKESLFNILNNTYYFDEINVLDLFAGSGNISFEFAARGCEEITAVDNNQKNTLFIKKTAAELGFEDIFVIKTDALQLLRSMKKKFDIIFADPPFDFKEIQEIPKYIFQRNLLNENGLFILEHSKRNNFANFGMFSEERTYGNVHFSFFKY